MSTTTITRRGILRALAGSAVTGVVGCAGLPSFSKPRKDDALVAFLSDAHVGVWRCPGYQPKKFAECIARVLALDPLPGKMIICGDLAFLWGRAEDYELAKKLLQPVVDAGIEVTIAMGNHDRRDNFLQFWPEYAKTSPVKDRIVSVVKGLHYDYIVIDSLQQGENRNKWITPGTLDDTQREWLRATCAAAKRPFFVVAHHPANELGAKGDPRTYACGYDFGRMLMGKDDQPTLCAGFIHGHDHEWRETRDLLSWKTPRVGHAVCLPSTGHWGDIGYALMRETPTAATLSLVQYDYFSPRCPKEADKEMRADWAAIVRDNQGKHCTFINPTTI